MEGHLSQSRFNMRVDWITEIALYTAVVAIITEVRKLLGSV